ncbi:hypothetical protein BN185_2200005 [Clostridioides difficile E28]|nr:hypothetical protein BN172_4710027 [Clostridioides difficile T15]CCL43526.1 hypothetical protein BN177_560022 [Clostridioides difficile E24]CCL47539.1 hypothetical protein BN178_790022 [Clostridioides difficile T42]CCL73939.1 hypothetical protein BN185_2200005 [Clostridioides difficile E28]CCL89160.1 hypothetical protein BN189_3860007 [Clostridioides difficile T10]
MIGSEINFPNKKSILIINITSIINQIQNSNLEFIENSSTTR